MIPLHISFQAITGNIFLNQTVCITRAQIEKEHLNWYAFGIITCFGPFWILVLQLVLIGISGFLVIQMMWMDREYLHLLKIKLYLTMVLSLCILKTTIQKQPNYVLFLWQFMLCEDPLGQRRSSSVFTTHSALIKLSIIDVVSRNEFWLANLTG